MKKQSYIILAVDPKPRVVTDENGKVKYFDWMDDAFVEARNYEGGIVINLRTKSII